jgi:hypothetical protein
MELPITHRFAPERHLLRYDLAIYKKASDYLSEKQRLVNSFEATEYQTLKINVA